MSAQEFKAQVALLVADWHRCYTAYLHAADDVTSRYGDARYYEGKIQGLLEFAIKTNLCDWKFKREVEQDLDRRRLALTEPS